MSERVQTTDYEGSYLLGEADGDIWSCEAHPNETQGLCLLSPDEVGTRDVFGQASAEWLCERADAYSQKDARFDAYSYYEGFLSAVRRARQTRVFAAAGVGRRW